IQNYFRMYDKLAGMTGTADTEAVEFKNIYSLDVAVIPTHKPMIRVDNNDSVYRTEREKFNAVVDEIKTLNKEGRPVLVGTTSIENSEKISKLLDKLKVNHQVLNAKQHEKEAEIVAQAGRIGAVTIATNMAGRGTDILLGGNPESLAKDIIRRKFHQTGLADVEPQQFEGAMLEAKAVCENEKKKVIELGGLHIIGTERHEARRVDNQLRGRSGRQGDPGSSRFFVSLEDSLMRIFASDRIASIMDRLRWEEGEPIEHKLITRAIENAQKQVEARNFDIRKHLLEYDDVLNKQRDVVYTKRKEILSGDSLKESVYEMSDELLESIVATYVPEKNSSHDLDLKELGEAVYRVFNVQVDFDGSSNGITRAGIFESLTEKIRGSYEDKENEIGSETLRQVEKYIMLQTLDYLWKDHLLSMDHLREGIGLRGYAQRDPLQEYKKEGYEIFSAMMDRFQEEVCQKLFRVRPVNEDEMERLERRRRVEQQRMILNRGESEEKRTPVKREKKIGRNDPCPCGSGKKYKKCCGVTAA
ncbi:MAG TPA: SEC-C metal-binding domain-containing protein, partial [Thermodesulfobacteriota bacterium]|nr:SEC-C metal-binding domain-containing protein [Thermodesulfobacteriota bacterium]